MRAGPTVQALTGPVGVGARVSSHRAGRMIADCLDVWDVQIEATADRAPRERLTLTAAPSLVPTGPGDPLAHYGQRLHVSQTLTIGGVETLVPIGWYQVETWEEQSDGTVKVEAYDLLQRLEKNPMAWPSSPPYGATVQSELQRLASSPEEGGVPVVLDTPDATVSREHEWGTSRVEAVGKLCEAHGLLWAVRSDGRLHAWAPGAPVSAAEYTGRDLLIESSRASGARRANRWVVGATGEGEDRESRYTAETTGYEYPYDPAGYGVVTDRNEMQIADGVSALYKAADTYRRNAQAAHGTRSLSIVPDPRLELWDTITVTVPHEAGPETLTGRVTATSLTIDKSDATMRVDLEVLSHA